MVVQAMKPPPPPTRRPFGSPPTTADEERGALIGMGLCALIIVGAVLLLFRL